MSPSHADEPMPGTCGGCGAELESRASLSICPACGWDAVTAAATGGPRRRLSLLAAGLRLLVIAGLVALPVLGFMRVLTTGPAADLSTTVRWVLLGDGGRAAELETIHRAFEIGGATARYAVRELAPPDFDGDWASALEPYATMNSRGWIPLVLIGADTQLAPNSVKELYRVKSVDGWGRPYQVSARALERAGAWAEDAEVAHDLELGLNETLFTLGEPDFDAAEHLRLELRSAGANGRHGDDDDLLMVSYVAVGFTFAVSGDRQAIQRQLDRAYFLGRHHFRLEGNRFDLVDARLLAEFRLECLS